MTTLINEMYKEVFEVCQKWYDSSNCTKAYTHTVDEFIFA